MICGTVISCAVVVVQFHFLRILSVTIYKILHTGDEVVMTHVNRMPVFKSTSSESWTSYTERLEFFLIGNEFTNDEQKQALLVSSFEPSTFHLVKSLVQPDKVQMKTYNEIVELLKNHVLCNLIRYRRKRT